MKLIHFILALLLMFPSLLNAQEESSSNSQRNISFTINATHLIDFTPSLQPGIVYHLSPKIDIAYEVGYITHFLSPFMDRSSHLRGVRMKSQVKYFMGEMSDNTRLYFGTDFLFKYHTATERTTYWMNDYEYSQIFDVTKTKQVFAASLIVGALIPANNPHFSIDMYWGLGFRNLMILKSGGPDESDSSSWTMFDRFPGRYLSPGLLFGVRLGFRPSSN
jgi:hypothetical protein